MKKQHDEELYLKCDCGHPFHLLFFGFDREGFWIDKAIPELYISANFYNGKLWERIKNAWKYIIKGEYSSEIDMMISGWGNLKELKNFTDKCLEGNEQKQKK